MSYFNNIGIYATDSPSIDAFGRMRISSPYTIFDSKQLYDTGSLFWSTQLIGNVTCSFISGAAAVSMSSGEANSKITRRTKRYFSYQPGKSQVIICTGNFDGRTNDSIKRIGYFDQSNGLFFTVTGSSFGTVLRKNGVDIFTSQSAWNLDKFDGAGPSAKTMDTTKSQIYFIDFEWLGVGRIRYGTYQSGIPYYVHEITNANALADVYMSNPNLPVTYELINSGSTPTAMYHICTAVMSEGGYESTGLTEAVDTKATVTAIAGNTEAGIIAVRLFSGSVNTSAIPQKVSAINASGQNAWAYHILINPTTSSNWVWQRSPNSRYEYATGSNTITNQGTKILSGFVSATSDATEILPPKIAYGLGSEIDGYCDNLVLSIRNLGGTSQNFHASLTFQEI